MSNDKYVSPLFLKAVMQAKRCGKSTFFTGYGIQDLRKTLDRATRQRKNWD